MHLRADRDLLVCAGDGVTTERMKQAFVYIVASVSRTLYVGVTSDLVRRMHQHKTKLLRGFTARYNVDRLVYFEETGNIRGAIEREKEIKGWTRAKKIALIENVNPGWADLAASLQPADLSS
ncbi:MAG TPA: GIY-YIG nuclease family protein [Longimicrobiaceae bacterium]|nr:GIY-YIG nuclease family protein [Longimicrobiaceae bacterium]